VPSNLVALWPEADGVKLSFHSVERLVPPYLHLPYRIFSVVPKPQHPLYPSMPQQIYLEHMMEPAKSRLVGENILLYIPAFCFDERQAILSPCFTREVQ
jgi:hypothetical protein